MAPVTFRTFVDNIEALVVAGVTRSYTQGPPGSLDAADLPSSWVQFPFGEEGPTVFGEQGGNTELQADLIVAVQAYGLGTPPLNFDATVNMMDAVAVAIRATGNCWPANSKARWSIRLGLATVSGNDYWAVITRIRGFAGF